MLTEKPTRVLKPLYASVPTNDTPSLFSYVAESEINAQNVREANRRARAAARPKLFTFLRRNRRVNTAARAREEMQLEEVYKKIGAGFDMFGGNAGVIKAVVKEVWLFGYFGEIGAVMDLRLMDDSFIQTPTTDPRTQRIIKELHRLTSTGAVAHEEIVELLLTEAKRIQWEHAEHEANGTPNIRQQLNVGNSHRRAYNIPAPDATREQAIMKEMYEKVTSAGAADAEGMLEVLLSEAVRAAKEDNGKAKDGLRAKL